MSRTVDVYFSLLSPWAYLGHRAFLEIAGRHGVTALWKPVMLGEVFAGTGGLPLPKRHPVRQRYRLVELQRWRARRGVDLVLQPRHWPFDAAHADRAVIAIAASGADPAEFIGRAFRAVWAEDRNLGDDAVLTELIDSAALDAGRILDAARGDEAGRAYAANRDAALTADVFGSPSYVLDGEVFWGQDRLDLLEEALASGRAPYGPAA